MPELLSAQKMAAKKPAQRTPVSRAPMEATSARLANWVAKTTNLKGGASSPNRLNPSMKNARSLKGRMVPCACGAKMATRKSWKFHFERGRMAAHRRGMLARPDERNQSPLAAAVHFEQF